MTYKSHLFLKPATLLMLFAFIFSACSSADEPEIAETIIEGQITVDPEIDSTMDYSGIELMIAFYDAQGEIRDTLFHSVTDSTGTHFGRFQAESRGVYPMIISRGGNRFGLANLVIAPGDTIRLNAQLPEFNETVAIQSVEHDAYERFERLDRNFNRVLAYISTQGMSTDSVEIEVLKWSDLFWDFYNQSEQTLAGERSAVASISLLRDWDNDLMLARTDTLLEQKNRLPADLRTELTQYHAETSGLDRAIAFLDQLDGRLTNQEEQMPIKREKIELLFDSARTGNAEQLLEQFRQSYADDESAMRWADNMQYDLATLVPGSRLPEFSFLNTEGEEISSETLSDSPFMIEFTRFDDRLYQQQYEQVVAIHQIYRNYGLKIITVPLATSDVALEAFFDERAKLWSVVEPGSFDADEIIETYNINRIPTRFLVNDRGSIIKRYVGTEFDTIIQGLQLILTQEDIES